MQLGLVTSFSARRSVAVAVASIILATAVGYSAPPHPDLIDRVESGQQPLPYFVANFAEMHRRGIGTGHNPYRADRGETKATMSGGPDFVGQFKALAILVQFSDQTSSTPESFFDSLIYAVPGNSVADYYSEVSYGQLDMVTVNLPSSLGWRTAPQTYAYYVNGQNGLGSYPQNTQKLVEDLVDQVNPLVDFSEYDNDDDGWVDVVIIVHTGTGAEYSGSNDDIWSHMWGISPRFKDGVYISDYTVQPEFWSSPGDMTIGVYAHELGHGFGLPDLYDVDNSSNGLGQWCIMAFGSWNGYLGNSPAHPCAWSRIQMGFASAQIIAANTYGQAIEAVENGGSIYRLWASGAIEPEYFLVENRQKVGYDGALPSSGLLVWHIDDNKSSNRQEWWPGKPDGEHYLVALEQADGLYELEHKWDHGDAGDPFPGALNEMVFDATTSPNSNSYTAGTSFVQVADISTSAPTMTADLIVGFSAGTDEEPDPLRPVSVELSQNYPNPFNPSTTISFTVSDATDVNLDVYNILGLKVRTLLDTRVSSGTTGVTWDGQDDRRRNVASGIYFYRLSAAGSERMKKMVLIR